MKKDKTISIPRFSGFVASEKASKILSKVRSKNTKTEIVLRKALWNSGFRFRKNYVNLPGHPDIVFLKAKVAIFVDGEFWHGYDWEDRKTRLKTNTEYWIPKIERNMQRDREQTQSLKDAGWTVVRLWEKQVINDILKCIEIIGNELTKNLNAKPK